MSIRSKIISLTDVAKRNHEKMLKIYNCNRMIPLTKEGIHWVEKQLNIRFANDFIVINQNYDYEFHTCFEFYSFYRNGCSGVVNKTLEFRYKLGLPRRYVILSNPGDTWVVLLETQESSDKNSPVICCAPEDWDNLIKEKPLKYDHIIWPSFTDFFEYLVEQEEESLQKGKV